MEYFYGVELLLLLKVKDLNNSSTRENTHMDTCVR